MKSLVVTVVALGTLTATVAARADQPPIIDRSLFFGEITIADAQISPDGRSMSFLKPYRGTRNIWVKKANEPFSAARPVSAESTRPIRIYFWSRDSKYLLYAQDAGGDENFNIYAIDPTLAANPQTGVPPTRALTNFKGVRTELFAAPRAKPDVLYIGLNDRDARWHDLYELHISTGKTRLLRKNTEQIAGWDFDNDGNLRLAERTNTVGDTELLRVAADGFKQIYSCTVLESCNVAGFDASNRQVYLITNKGALELTELDLMDPRTGVTSRVEGDPERRVDLRNVATSEVDYRILFTEYEDDVPRLYFRDKAFEQGYRWLKAQLPGKEITFGSRSRDESIWVLTAYSDTDPGATYIWNRRAQTLALQYRIREELPRASLSERQPYQFKSSDGLVIRGYLTLPKGLPATTLPLIVWPHGGPWARDSYGYDTYAQFLANRGYAVLQPNFRGSTGYGKQFLNAGNGEWGRKMQDDLTWGVKALVNAGTVDPKRVGIGGGSYGGYATLAGVAFTPNLYAAAVAYVAPSNLITLLDAIPPYWEAGRKQMYTRMADPTTPQGKALLVAESPLTQAKAIVTPLLVVQGKNDPRVNIRESDQIVAAVRDNGKPVEYLVAPDEGHGFARPINSLALVTAMEGFYARYLGGRQQTDVPPDVAARLTEITVDPKTVSGAVTLKGADAMNPYSPRYGHPYRHGAVPTRTAHGKMQTWWSSHQVTQSFAPGTGPQTLSFGGGIDGIGVTSGTPKVYLVIYGSQWGEASTDAHGDAMFGGDSSGEVPRLQQLFKGLGTGGELWSGTMTQYCDGSQVNSGATNCPSNAAHVGYPTAGVLAGVWYDNSIASPASATGNQLASEAIKAAAHFGNTTAASNRFAQYVILSPPGTNPDGFNTNNGNFCAWHDYNADAALSGGAAPSSYGDIAFTNMPFITDAGSGCGVGFVNSGPAGALDGVTIVAGHEYAETVTDQNPAGGWTNQTGTTYGGQENGDECAWIASGQGASANMAMGNGSYPLQSTWSNDTNRCDISHPVVH